MITSYNTITAQEAKGIMDEEDVIVVDVRTIDEYNEGHIRDAIVVPNEQIERIAGEKLPNKSAKTLVYCRSGSRSSAAAKKLSKMGYTNVYDFGGIIDWPYDTVK